MIMKSKFVKTGFAMFSLGSKDLSRG